MNYALWQDAILDFESHDKIAQTITNVIDAAMNENAIEAVIPRAIKPTHETSATDNA